MPSDGASPSRYCEITCVGPPGRRVRLFPPILGTICDHCSTRADDVCFLVEGPGAAQSGGGLCGPCLVSLLESVPRRAN